MECHGPVNGHTPTGIGGYEEDFRYGTKDPDTCQQGGEGEGVWRAFVPTTAGEQRLDAPFTLTYGDLTSNPGSVTAEFQGEGVHGTASVTPVEGDCVVKPITRVRVKAEFYFAQSFFRRQGPGIRNPPLPFSLLDTNLLGWSSRPERVANGGATAAVSGFLS